MCVSCAVLYLSLSIMGSCDVGVGGVDRTIVGGVAL